jgi:8-oxo-dGTP diphosphatase
MDTKLQQHLNPLLVVAGIAHDRGRFLLMRRKAGLIQEGKWEFPGGKVDVGENLSLALQREIKEELNIGCWVGGPIGVGHFYDGIVVGYNIELEARPEKSNDHDKIEWVPSAELLSYPLAPADYALAVAAICQHVEFERVKIGSLVRLLMGVYFLAGVLIAAGLFIANYFLAGFFPLGTFPIAGFPAGEYGVAALFVIVFVYTLLGAVLGLVAAGFYNLLSRILGGLQFELRRK